jgi:transcriptional regulator with XRE-family HTH domain
MEARNGIKSFRKRAGFKSQSALASVLGIKPQNVSNWEAGDSFPSYQIIKRLFELGATVEELFDIEYNNISEPKQEESDNYLNACACGSKDVRAYATNNGWLVECSLCGTKSREEKSSYQAIRVWNTVFKR